MEFVKLTKGGNCQKTTAMNYLKNNTPNLLMKPSGTSPVSDNEIVAVDERYGTHYPHAVKTGNWSICNDFYLVKNATENTDYQLIKNDGPVTGGSVSIQNSGIVDETIAASVPEFADYIGWTQYYVQFTLLNQDFPVGTNICKFTADGVVCTDHDLIVYDDDAIE